MFKKKGEYKRYKTHCEALNYLKIYNKEMLIIEKRVKIIQEKSLVQVNLKKKDEDFYVKEDNEEAQKIFQKGNLFQFFY